MEKNNYLFNIEINKEKNKLLIQFNKTECVLDLFTPVESEMEELFDKIMSWLISKKDDLKSNNNINYVKYTKNENDKSIEELIKQNFSELFEKEISLIINEIINNPI